MILALPTSSIVSYRFDIQKMTRAHSNNSARIRGHAGGDDAVAALRLPTHPGLSRMVGRCRLPSRCEFAYARARASCSAQANHRRRCAMSWTSNTGTAPHDAMRTGRERQSGWLFRTRASVGARATGRAALFMSLASACASPRSLAMAQSPSPVALLSIPWNGVVQWPSIAARSDTFFIVGNVFHGDSVPARPAYLGRLWQNASGGLVALPPLELPPGDFQFAYPRIVAAGDRLHLVWAEFATRPASVRVWPQVTLLAKGLWHATLDNGVWSAPEKIAGGYELGWSDETGAATVDASGALHVTAWMADSGSIPQATDLRLLGGHWDRTSFPYTGLNPSVAFASHGRTSVVALVDERLDTARVVVLESSDHGNHWTNPRMVASRPRREGSFSRLAFVATDDGFVLAIGEKADKSYYLDTIRVLRLHGSTVLSATQFLPPTAADQFVMTGTACGSAVMLTRELSATPQLVEITIPRSSPISEGRRLLEKAGLSTFAGIVAGPQSVVAVFAYNPEVGTAAHTAALTLRVCPP